MSTRSTCPNWLTLYQVIISHAQLVSPHVSHQQVAGEPIHYRDNFGLLTTWTLHALLSQMPLLVLVTPF